MSEAITHNDPDGQFDIGGGGGLWQQVIIYVLLFQIAFKLGGAITWLWERNPWLS